MIGCRFPGENRTRPYLVNSGSPATILTNMFNGVAPPAGGAIQIVLSSGSAFVYGSTTDNRTNDSHIQFAARR